MMRLTTLLLAGALGLAGCGHGTERATPAGSAPGDRSETTFLDVTAAHLCAVQSRVYADPAALAAAYQNSPQYPGLSDAQVAGFKQRLTSDTAFTGRLAQRIQATCGSRPGPGPAAS